MYCLGYQNIRPAKFIQRGCVTSIQQAAFDMRDYYFGGGGYVYWFGTYWCIYTK